MEDLKKHFPGVRRPRVRARRVRLAPGMERPHQPGFNDEYEKNLANFIRDIRKDLGVQEPPFVIAETGMSGPKEKHPRALSLMKAQAAVAEYQEFKGNVAFVGTKASGGTRSMSPRGRGTTGTPTPRPTTSSARRWATR